MTNLILARHGQTAWNIEGRWQGHADTPLDETGLEQARLLAGALNGERFAAIYSSDLQRALVTAEMVARAHGQSVHTDPRLRELNMGAWEGRFVTEIPALFPESWAARQNDPVGSKPPGGESVLELAGRMLAAMSAICAQHPPESRLLVVSHGLALAVFLCRVHGRPLVEAFDNIPRNASPVYLSWQPGTFSRAG